MIQLFCDFWCRSAIDKDLNFDRDLLPTICIMRINMLQTIGYGINIYMVTFYECVFKIWSSHVLSVRIISVMESD